MRRAGPLLPAAARTPGAVLLPALAAAGLLLAGGLVPFAVAAEESAAGILEMAGRYATLVRETIPILERRVDPPTLDAALHETRRAVAEIDRLSANAAIFQAAPRERQQLQDISAAAHLHLALFETHGLEFERAKREIARARSISDLVENADFRTEWVALQTGKPGVALQTRYNLLTLTEFESALGSIWYRARPVGFEFRGFTTQDLALVQIVPASQPPAGSLEERLWIRGAAQFRRTVDAGQPAFSVSLPSGVYRLQGRTGADIDRSFVVPEATDPDPVYVDRARFALRLEPRPGPKPPRFFLNGIEMKDLAAMPYGVYRIKADPDEYPAVPQIVRFVLGEGIPDKTRTSWTIYVPPGAPAVLELARGTAAGRRR